MASGALKGQAGETFAAGRMGNFTIEADPTRPGTSALRVVMGPFSVYNKDNIDKEVGAAPSGGGGQAATAKPGQTVKMILLPKFLGIAVFDQAHNGAEEAAKELQNPTALTYTGPTADNSVQGQIETVTNAATQGVNVLMVSNNAGDQLAPAAQAFQKAGGK